MVMTHGKTLLDHPSFLARLVEQGGLRKLAIHIDMTQAGRPGFPIRQLTSEADLHPVRQAFVEPHLPRPAGDRSAPSSRAHGHRQRSQPREHWGDPRLVNRRNVDGWTPFGWPAFKPRRTWDAPGCRRRRRWTPKSGTKSAKRSTLESHATPCGSATPTVAVWTSLLVLYPERRVIKPDSLGCTYPRVRVGHAQHLRRDRFPRQRHGRSQPEARRDCASQSRIRVQGAALRPSRDCSRSGCVPGWPCAPCGTAPRPLNIVLHDFMSADEVRSPRSAVTEQRPAACAFRGAVRRNGVWKAVPMCAMNVNEREEL